MKALENGIFTQSRHDKSKEQGTVAADGSISQTGF
jgi:hypothetical protein